ncbi:hypothetical protein EDD16DRAFT_1695229 [Pisolithus croceorrhizus]|nr:hypothetical protein EDD16DRAFT_1695229 [Pisolithus croceorrhizus]KAI6122413.1 hypothetical protein EV401DRAFT_2056489 [Pisolithus croceorrhizus]
MNVQATLSRHSQLAGLDEEEWEDIDYIPLNLHPPVGSKYLTVINLTGLHFMLSWPCQCMNAESYHKQLFHAKLYPSTFEKPIMVFTSLVLDDFLRQSWQWHLLKLLKWSGYQGNLNDSMRGDLALFCTACPQPGINPSPQANLDDWRYTRTVVMDGNFKAEHMCERRLDDQVWLMDGHGFMVSIITHGTHSLTIQQKLARNNHKAISQASASHRKLNSTGVGTTTCAQHGCFYPHSVMDFQKGKR